MEWDDILLEIAWKRHEESMIDKREVETKASFILAANGVLLGLVVNAAQILWVPLMHLSLCFIIASTILCVMSLRVRKYFTLKPEKAQKVFENADDILEFKRRLFDNLSKHEVYNTKQVNKSAGFLKWAIYSFVVSIILVATSLACFFLFPP